ncbi:MAG: hypothetical protein BWY80_00903 [Firmicutes bacterium ADurb.Bin456]|nr:MAG: hypothetical protein BWY80_00903 [Firmicutes bacterium ADurb.Bin456]
MSGKLFAHSFDCFKALGGILELLFCQQEGPDGSVRTYEGALVTLDAIFGNPFRYKVGDATFFILGCSHGETSVFPAREGADRQFVTLQPVHYLGNIHNEFGHFFRRFIRIHCVFPGFGHVNLYHAVYTHINCPVVHIDNGIALPAVCLLDGALQFVNGLFNGDDVGEFKESGLQDHVVAVTQPKFFRFINGVDGIKIDIIVGDIFPHGSRETFIQLLGAPDAVKEESAALLKSGKHIKGIHVGLVAARHEIRVIYEVGGFNWLLAKAQVRNRKTTGFFGIVRKIGLRIEIS